MRILAILLFLSACVTRQDVEMDIWVAEQIPTEHCTGEVWKRGIFRVVSCKNKPDHPLCVGGRESYEEFIPYCHPAMNEYLSMHREDANKWLEKLTKPRTKNVR